MGKICSNFERIEQHSPVRFTSRRPMMLADIHILDSIDRNVTVLEDVRCASTDHLSPRHYDLGQATPNSLHGSTTEPSQNGTTTTDTTTSVVTPSVTKNFDFDYIIALRAVEIGVKTSFIHKDSNFVNVGVDSLL